MRIKLSLSDFVCFASDAGGAPPPVTTEVPAADATPPAKVEIPVPEVSLVGDKPAPAEPVLGADGKPIEAKPGDAPKPEDEAKPPVEYTDFTVPEGMELEPEAVGKFKEFAATKNLSQEDAQGLLNMHTDALKEAALRPYQAYKELQETWIKEITADPEIGGDNLPKVQRTIASAIDKYGDDAFRDAMKLTGAGNNPAVVKFLAKVSSALTEGGLITGNAPSAVKTIGAHTMFKTPGDS